MTMALKIDGKRLQAFLDLFGLSMSDLAREAGYDRSYLSKALGGKLTPSPAFLAAMAVAVEKIARERRVDSSYFLQGCSLPAAPAAEVTP